MEKDVGESSFKAKIIVIKKRNLCTLFVPYHGVPYPWYDVQILTKTYVTLSCYTLLHQAARVEAKIA